MPRRTKKRSTEVSTEKLDRGFFAQVPLQLLNDDREGITSYTLAVYAAIQSYTTFGKTTGAHPNTEQVATRAHCSEATVERERNRLKELGYVTWISGSFKLRKGNEYTLLFPSHRGEHSDLFPSHRGEHSEIVSLPQRGYVPPTEGITSLPQREHRESVTENQNREGKSARKCSHPDTACCPNCLTPTVVSKPSSPSSPKSSPKSESPDEEDF